MQDIEMDLLYAKLAKVKFENEQRLLEVKKEILDYLDKKK